MDNKKLSVKKDLTDNFLLSIKKTIHQKRWIVKKSIYENPS